MVVIGADQNVYWVVPAVTAVPVAVFVPIATVPTIPLLETRLCVLPAIFTATAPALVEKPVRVTPTVPLVAVEATSARTDRTPEPLTGQFKPLKAITPVLLTEAYSLTRTLPW